MQDEWTCSNHEGGTVDPCRLRTDILTAATLLGARGLAPSAQQGKQRLTRLGCRRALRRASAWLESAVPARDFDLSGIQPSFDALGR